MTQTTTPAHLRNREYVLDLVPALELEPEQEIAPAPARQIARPTRTARPAPANEASLVDPRLLDRTLPVAKTIAAAIGWINSIATTVLSANQLQTFVTDKPSTWVAIVAGLAVAAFLTFGQIYASGRSRKVYALFLFPDALMTSIQWSNFLLIPLLVKLIPASWPLAVAIAAIIGGIIGIVSARTPERLAFGEK